MIFDLPHSTHFVSNKICDIWIGETHQDGVAYCYGGTRLCSYGTSEPDCLKILYRLMTEESGFKNSLINKALSNPEIFSDKKQLFPKGFLESRVGGARCILRPKNEKAQEVLSNPLHPDFYPAMRCVMKDVGDLLNTFSGRIKLTPDFRRFEGVADVLAEFTPHVLGIACEQGGCGGKASYTVSGIASILSTMGISRDKKEPITLIGSAGALGAGVLRYLEELSFSDLGVCDLRYDNADESFSGSPEIRVFPSELGRFTDDCMKRGGWIIATTFGGELENSSYATIPSGSRLILAHNLSQPSGQTGIDFMKSLENITCVPGQLLTLGGALTSRYEWFWRQQNPGKNFQNQKPLAHQIVHRVTEFLWKEVFNSSKKSGETLYESMLSFGR